MTSWVSFCYSADLISGKTSKCFTFFLWVLKSESLATTFGFRECVNTLPDDISIRTTKPLAAASVVKQKYLFSFQNKPKPNAGAWHKSQRPHVSWRNVVQLEPSCSAQRVPSSCVSSPEESSWKWQKALHEPPVYHRAVHTYCTPTFGCHQKSLGPQTQSSAVTQWERWGNLAILGFRAGLMGTDSDCTELPNSHPPHQQKVEWSVKESRNKLSSDCGRKTEIFVKACRNYSSPRASAAMSNSSYQLLQQVSPKQIFPFLYIALISIALHPATRFSLYIFSLSIWQRNKTWDELL